jgi:hypothetical protein
VYSIDHINSYTQKEIDTIWYNDRELKLIKAECLETTVLVMERKQLNEQTECFRGLEYRTPDGHRRRLRNKVRARDAVLDEQEHQWDTLGEEDDYDPESIATVYNEYTQPCIAAAHSMGLADEIQAMLIYQEYLTTTNAAGATGRTKNSTRHPHQTVLIDNRWGITTRMIK